MEGDWGRVKGTSVFVRQWGAVCISFFTNCFDSYRQLRWLVHLLCRRLLLSLLFEVGTMISLETVRKGREGVSKGFARVQGGGGSGGSSENGD